MTTPVAGPGKFSERTDKAVSTANASLPDAQYGENRDYQELKSSAPMADSGVIANSFSSLFGNPAAGIIGLNEDSQLPDVPVTDGAALGPGQGPEALARPDSQQKQYAESYLIALEFLANQPGASDAAREAVRNLKSQL